MRKARSSVKTSINKQNLVPPVAGISPSVLSHPLLQIALLALVALLAYANTFQVPFVFDDNSSIVENGVIKELSGFLSGAGHAYNPRRFIGYLSFALNYTAGGLDVTGYHVVNLAVHIVSAWLVYFLVRLTLQAPFSAQSPGPATLSPHRSLVPLLAALLFVAHPVQTQAVTYIVQRLASLATMFYLLSLVLYIKARFLQEDKGRLFAPTAAALYILSLIASLAAMRTKEIAVTLPIVILLYEFSFLGSSARKRLIVLIPLLLTLLIIPLSMMHAGKPLGQLLSDVSDMTRETQVISRGDYLVTQFAVVATYLRLLFFPINQNLDYDYPLYNSIFAPRVFFSFLLLAALLALAVHLYRISGKTVREAAGRPETAAPPRLSGWPKPESRLIAFGILWFFITLSVESSLIPIADVIFEHRLYLPSVGAFIAIAAAVAVFFRNRRLRAVATVAALAVVILAAATWRRNLVWANNLALWGDAVVKSPGKSRTNDSFAKALADAGRDEEALGYLQKAVRIDPRNGVAAYNIGRILDKQDRIDEAITWYRAAIALQSDLKEAYNNLAVDYLLTGKIDEAIETYQAVLKNKPDFAEAHNNVGTALRGRNRIDEAIDHYRSALSLKPEYAKARNNLGVAYLDKGDVDMAIKELQTAVSLKPDDQEFRVNLERAVRIKQARK